MVLGAPWVGMAQPAPRRRTAASATTATPVRRLTPRLPARRRRRTSTGSVRTKRAPPVGRGLDPDGAVHDPHVLGHQRQPEPGPRARAPPARRRAPVEASNTLVRSGGSMPGPGVVDGHLHLLAVAGRLDRDRGDAAAVVVRVLHQVDHDPLEAALVHADPPRLHRGVDAHRGRRPVAVAVHVPEPGLDRPLHQLGDVDLLEEDVDRAGVGPRHLEEVGHHALEAPEVVAEQLEGPLGARGSSSRSASSTSSGGGQGGQGERSSWLTSELNRASRSMRSWSWSTMALNELVRPSRSGSAAVGVEPGVELAAGDGPGRPGHVGQRPQRPCAGEAAEGDAQEGGDDAGAEEGEPEDPQRVVEVGEVEDLEVGGVHRGDGDPDDDLGRSLRRCGRSGWPPSRPGPPGAARPGWTPRDRQGGVVRLGLVVEHGVGVGAGVDGRQEHRRTGCRRWSELRTSDGVGEGLVLGRRLAPGQQEVAGR